MARLIDDAGVTRFEGRIENGGSQPDSVRLSFAFDTADLLTGILVYMPPEGGAILTGQSWISVGTPWIGGTVTYAITSAAPGDSRFVLDGDATAVLTGGTRFVVTGEGANDGIYTVVFSNLTGGGTQTTVTVVETVADNTSGGTVTAGPVVVTVAPVGDAGDFLFSDTLTLPNQPVGSSPYAIPAITGYNSAGPPWIATDTTPLQLTVDDGAGGDSLPSAGEATIVLLVVPA